MVREDLKEAEKDQLCKREGSGPSSTMNKSSRVYVAGHRGLVGSAIVKKLESEGIQTL